MSEPPIDAEGMLTRRGKVMAARALVLAALLVALGFALGQPIPALVFAALALALPAAGVAHLRRQHRP